MPGKRTTKAKVELVKDPITKLLNRWQQRRAVHERLSKQLIEPLETRENHNSVAATLGFCIRELEEVQRKMREE